VPADSLSAAVALILKATDAAFVVAVPDLGDAVSQLGTLVIAAGR
jgi:predicted RNase H-like HicB family nuclease